jgi:hypothetical protein
MANEISKRRHQTNTFYISLSSSLITLFSLITVKILPINSKLILIIPFLGIIICLIWFTHLKSYKKLNWAKFKIINDIEKDLPYQGFTEEWDLLNKANYKRLTDIERYVPLILIIPYLILSLSLLWSDIMNYI